MTDIVEELRADADAGIGWAAKNLRRAADEIERLRDALKHMEESNEELAAEIKRLRFTAGEPEGK